MQYKGETYAYNMCIQAGSERESDEESMETEASCSVGNAIRGLRRGHHVGWARRAGHYGRASRRQGERKEEKRNVEGKGARSTCRSRCVLEDERLTG